ncbi:GNAT family N-acetyltransferase [Streptomyces sp. NA04227]|uniref:GNAT family N-acetyltransferase n=1 Tax=Streptomyces sp. NA04227 TaxID=2742136 RepID=UPI001590F9D3|nr:GNAT family N-acetyltransferase [Streptomyces sp. NA04227]QKW06471.1 GNAT family N-acetyltransferase [Streptomyces sp. NA04227]
MTTDMRVLREQDFDDWFDRLELAFGGVADAPEERALWRELTAYERSLVVRDDGETVGSAGAFSFRMTVPGGQAVPAAGVTMVSVAATHRRRGLLTAMMRRQLDDVRALGEPLAVLMASEPVIYGRFGYGCATRQLAVEIDTDRVGLALPEGTDRVRVRYADPEASLARCEELYARLLPTRPGRVARGPGWERLGLLDPPGEREGASPLQCVLAEVDGELVGYARYAIKPEWNPSGPEGKVVLRQLEAVDPAAHAALWRFLFGIDLTSSVSARNLPLDEPVQFLASDPRRCGLSARDGLYVRLVDVPAALAARTYAAPVDVVLEVADDFCQWNAGRWLLRGDSAGASCERTERDPQLALSARDLGAVYLGDTRLSSLAAAGRVRELSPGAVARTSPGFASDVAPWMPHGF